MHVALMQQEARGEVELVDGQEGGSLDVMMPFMIWAVWICGSRPVVFFSIFDEAAEVDGQTNLVQPTSANRT